MDRDDYGWSLLYPQTRLTTTRHPMANQPTDPRHKENLSRLSDFLGELPFAVTINSAFRSPAVNSAVDGSSTSQHMNGLGADIKPLTPVGISADNKDLATYFWHYRDKIPELDQVIWYTGKSHVHLGICPKNGTGCPPGARPGQGRHEFLVNDHGSTRSWAPSAADQSTIGARFLIALGPPRNWKKTALIATGVTAGILLVGAGLLWWYTRD